MLKTLKMKLVSGKFAWFNLVFTQMHCMNRKSRTILCQARDFELASGRIFWAATIASVDTARRRREDSKQ